MVFVDSFHEFCTNFSLLFLLYYVVSSVIRIMITNVQLTRYYHEQHTHYMDALNNNIKYADKICNLIYKSTLQNATSYFWKQAFYQIVEHGDYDLEATKNKAEFALSEFLGEHRERYKNHMLNETENSDHDDKKKEMIKKSIEEMLPND